MSYSMNKCDFTNIAFKGAEDSLGTLKGKIKERFESLLPARTQPKICAVFLLASKAFTVKLSDGCELDALETPSGKFIVDFDGSVANLTFSADVTIDYLGVDWMTVGQ